MATLLTLTSHKSSVGKQIHVRLAGWEAVSLVSLHILSIAHFVFLIRVQLRKEKGGTVRKQGYDTKQRVCLIPPGLPMAEKCVEGRKLPPDKQEELLPLRQ